FITQRSPHCYTLSPYTTLFRSLEKAVLSLAEKYKLMNRLILSGKVQLENISSDHLMKKVYFNAENILPDLYVSQGLNEEKIKQLDRKSTRLNSSHVSTSYAVFC